jgi:hypothetical protein
MADGSAIRVRALDETIAEFAAEIRVGETLTGTITDVEEV